MANIDLDWDVEGIITPEESVTKMLNVIAEKGREDSGTFWCWDGRVRSIVMLPSRNASANTILLGTSLVRLE